MKNISRLSLLFLSIVTLFFASCGEMKNKVKGPDIVSDDDTYVAVGDFTSPQFTLQNATVAVDIDLDSHTADMTFYNFTSMDGNMMNVVSKGLKLENTKTTATFTIDEVIPVIKMADKEVLYASCPLVKVSGTVNTEDKTMVINFTMNYTTPFQQTMEIPVVFNGKIVEAGKEKEVIPEQAQVEVDYEEEIAANGVLKVDGKIIPKNTVRVAIDLDNMKANMYLATMSLNNGKDFITLEATDINIANTANGYELNAESVVPILETGMQIIYYPACKFENIKGTIDKKAGTMVIDLVFVYVDPETQKEDEYPATFIGKLGDPDDSDDVEQKIYTNDYLATGDFKVVLPNDDEYNVNNRMVGVDVDKNTMTANISFYAFSYGDEMPELTVLTNGLSLTDNGNGYTFSIAELSPMVQTVGETFVFEDARFLNMLGTIDTGAKTMQINFDIEYTDSNKQITVVPASYTGKLAE